MRILERKGIEQKPNIGIVSIGDLTLESGIALKGVELAFEQVGAQQAPVILVCHALTGSQFAVGTSEEPGWWHGLIGPNKAIDTNKFQVITFNVLGGCNGSTGPTSVNPITKEAYLGSFPKITIRDMVKAERLALNRLGISKLFAVMGGSLGGMQVLEWGLLFPNDMEKLFVYAATPYFSDYGIAFNRIAIEAIENDPNWKDGYYERSSDVKGLEVARMVGMVTYRSSEMFSERFTRAQKENTKKQPLFEVESYLKHQGTKLSKRFDVNSYVTLLYAMNSHDIGRDRGGHLKALEHLKAKFISVGFENDLIYPPKIMEKFASSISNCNHYEVNTKYGHDGFLVEFDKWGYIVKNNLEN